MICFSLSCDHDHQFDGWFGSSGDFESQKGRGLVTCPVCNSAKVSKSLMAPKVSTGRTKDKINAATVKAVRREAIGEMKKLRDKVLDGAEDVGKQFPEEARKMHYGESEKKHVFGEASQDEVKSLLDEGVTIAPVPVLPDDVN